ncbi:MAG: archaeosortase/exosortase family protein [Candidatus Aenigmarchaeota archaeon]|nr:archaeosortase/exosortase family protein [Candidatus Aenigmarchaeota archaeon]
MKPYTNSENSNNIFRIKINSETAKFILIFIGSLSVFYFISIQFESFIPLFNMLSTTKTLFYFLKTIGINADISENQIIFPNFSIEVIRQCTGIFEVIAIISCILGFPSSIKKKIIGIFMAVPIIYFFNMGRLIFLSIIGVYYQPLFEIIHEYLLQVTFVFFVIFFWVFWIDKVVKNGKI